MNLLYPIGLLGLTHCDAVNVQLDSPVFACTPKKFPNL